MLSKGVRPAFADRHRRLALHLDQARGERKRISVEPVHHAAGGGVVAEHDRLAQPQVIDARRHQPALEQAERTAVAAGYNRNREPGMCAKFLRNAA
ncbi:hypothetical protein SDC9_121662 [bioreactor metagenome]|uniref:Uncharacterized protein n=1 Tax=bioreactor metagenome TaxID=1076179 RepID=A0A645CCM4_9ZZZZ